MKNLDNTKMGADESAENTPNAPYFLVPICLSKPKSLGFLKKALSGCPLGCAIKDLWGLCSNS